MIGPIIAITSLMEFAISPELGCLSKKRFPVL
jgi:hypothetical protein